MNGENSLPLGCRFIVNLRLFFVGKFYTRRYKQNTVFITRFVALSSNNWPMSIVFSLISPLSSLLCKMNLLFHKNIALINIALKWWYCLLIWKLSLTLKATGYELCQTLHIYWLGSWATWVILDLRSKMLSELQTEGDILVPGSNIPVTVLPYQ